MNWTRSAMRRELDAAFDHAVRRERAYDYLRQVDARRWRRCGLILLGSVAIFAWSLVLALLVGAV